jgi:ATP-dependent Clp protease protease subunit
MNPTRRRALTLFAAALPASIPLLAQAQGTSVPPIPPAPAPSIIPPPPADAPTPPGILPGTRTAGAAPARPAPIIIGQTAIDRTKRYFVFFDQTIDANSMKALRRQLTALVEAGVQDILLSIHSPGGLIDPMLATYSFIRALPVRIDTHATSFVMSAATTLYLAGENRSADRSARFLFHPSQAPFLGSMSSTQMQDRLIQFDTVESVARQIYHDRTTLTDEQIARFNREEVFFTADQAREAGIVQTVRDLHIPGPDKARIVFVD